MQLLYEEQWKFSLNFLSPWLQICTEKIIIKNILSWGICFCLIILNKGSKKLECWVINHSKSTLRQWKFEGFFLIWGSRPVEVIPLNIKIILHLIFQRLYSLSRNSSSSWVHTQNILYILKVNRLIVNTFNLITMKTKTTVLSARYLSFRQSKKVFMKH